MSKKLEWKERPSFSGLYWFLQRGSDCVEPVMVRSKAQTDRVEGAVVRKVAVAHGQEIHVSAMEGLWYGPIDLPPPPYQVTITCSNVVSGALGGASIDNPTVAAIYALAELVDLRLAEIDKQFQPHGFHAVATPRET